MAEQKFSISRILVVDSMAMMRTFIHKKLAMHFNILEAATLEEGKKILNEEEIDCLILARTLKDGSGYDLAKFIKDKKDIPVIMLIADEDVTIAEASPYVDEYLSKMHLTAEKIENVVNKLEKIYLDKESRKDKKVLVVDDSPMIRKAIVNLLKKDFEVIEAENGKEAFKQALEHLPDLITMDVDMPQMDGITATSLIRTHVRTRKIPVVLVTSHVDSETVLKGFSVGVNAYLPKNASPKELAAKIKEMLLNPKKNTKETIALALEPDWVLELALQFPLQNAGYKILLANSIEDLKGLDTDFDMLFVSEGLEDFEEEKKYLEEIHKSGKKIIVVSDDETDYGFADDFLKKPFTADDLLNKVIKHLL